MASYFRNTHGIIVTYDVTTIGISFTTGPVQGLILRVESFMNVTNWLQEIDLHGQENVVKLLVGNKADLTSEREVSYDTAKVSIYPLFSFCYLHYQRSDVCRILQKRLAFLSSKRRPKRRLMSNRRF